MAIVAGLLVAHAIVPGGPGPALVPPVQAATRASSPSPATPPPKPGTRAFARVRGLVLFVPTRHAVLIGYHEASYPEALAMTPLGRCAHDYNRTKFHRPRRTPGPAYLVMSSRGRPTRATSAVDVAMRTGTPVLSPVTGHVSKVRRYRLYGAYRDFELTLVEDGQPNFIVLLIHIANVRVTVGQPLVAGVTRLGTVRDLPFESQVNDYVGVHIQHVHIEVKRVGGTGR